MIFYVVIGDINRDIQKSKKSMSSKEPQIEFRKSSVLTFKNRILVLNFLYSFFFFNFSNLLKSLPKKNVEKRKKNFLLVATVLKMGSVNLNTTIGIRAVRVPPVAFVVDLPARIIIRSSVKAASVPFRSNEKILSEFSI